MTPPVETCLIRQGSDTLDIAFKKGDWAASQGYRRDQNPYPVGIQHREWWDAGWSNSYDELCGETLQPKDAK